MKKDKEDFKKRYGKDWESVMYATATKQAKENGELFAPIKPKEISRYFQENFKEDINPSQIDLKQEIKKIGKFSLSINLHSDVLAELQVLVEKKEAK